MTITAPEAEEQIAGLLTTPEAEERISDLVTHVRVTFDRIGRSRDVAPLDVESCDPDVIAEAVWRYARSYLVSRDVEVSVDLDAMTVSIFAGFNNGGGGTVEHTSPEVWL